MKIAIVNGGSRGLGKNMAFSLAAKNRDVILPEDIGGVVASLLSDDNRRINAQRIEASGGMFL